MLLSLINYFSVTYPVGDEDEKEPDEMDEEEMPLNGVLDPMEVAPKPAICRDESGYNPVKTSSATDNTEAVDGDLII